jgi:hypothetical protein
MVFFMIFTILFLRDMLKIKGAKHISPVHLIVTFLFVLFLAILVELLQDKMKLGREGDIIDIVYDLFGYIFGVLIFVLRYGIRPRSL